MRQYLVQHSYRSGPYTWQAGDLVELEDAEATWVGNDSPGCIVPADEPKPVVDPEPAEVETDDPVERQADSVRDRQARPARNRGR